MILHEIFTNIVNHGIMCCFFKTTLLCALLEKCSYSEFLWSVFSRNRTEYRDIGCISPYSAQMREITGQKTPNTDTFHVVVMLAIKI